MKDIENQYESELTEEIRGLNILKAWFRPNGQSATLRNSFSKGQPLGMADPIYPAVELQ